MEKDENFNTQSLINAEPAFINVIEAHVNYLEEGKCKDAQHVIKSMNSFIKNLKDDCVNFNEKPVAIKDSQCNSLLSIMDIKMDISDDNPIYNLMQSTNRRDEQCHGLVRNFELNHHNKVKLKDAKINTEAIPKCDVLVQTKKISDYADFVQDLYYLKGQSNIVEDSIGMLLSKYNNISALVKIALEKLKTLMESYNPSLDPKLKSARNAETETCISWLEKWNVTMSYYCQLPVATEQLALLTQNNTELEERNNRQMKETEEQFELLEELMTKNEELAKTFDSLMVELTDAKDMDEFQRSEIGVLSSSLEKLREDFKGYIKCQSSKMRDDVVGELRRERNQWLAENRALQYQLENEVREAIMDNTNARFAAKETARLREALRNYPLYGNERANAVVTLKKKLSLLEDESFTLSQDRERWMSQKSRLATLASDEDHCLKRNNEALEIECGQLEEDLRREKEQRDKYMLCFGELRQVCLENETLPSGNGNNNCRAILNTYDC